MPRVLLTVEVETNDVWLIVNRRELREGMSEKEAAAVITEIADLKLGWETSGYFGGSSLRVNSKEQRHGE